MEKLKQQQASRRKKILPFPSIESNPYLALHGISAGARQCELHDNEISFILACSNHPPDSQGRRLSC